MFGILQLLLALASVGSVVGVLLHAFGHRRARQVDKAALVMAAVAVVFPFLLLVVRPSMFFGRGDQFNLGPFVVAVLVAGPTLLVSAITLLNSSPPPFE